MIIERISKLSGLTHAREIAVTEEQYARWQANEGLIQDIMPDVSREDREFLISGVTPEEWEAAYGSET